MKTLLNSEEHVDCGRYSLDRIGSTRRWKLCERGDVLAIEKMIERECAAEDREEFVQKLRPILRYVGNHARRELRLMEAYERLSPGEIVLEDLLEELVDRAWTQFADRPQWIEFDLWLTRIADEILEEQVNQDQCSSNSLKGVYR